MIEFARPLYISRLVERKENGLVKVITGARRAGKSYILNDLYYRYLLSEGIPDNHIIRFAFDSDEDIDLLDEYHPEIDTVVFDKRRGNIVNSKKFRSYIKDRTSDDGMYYFLLDEVQQLDNFVGTLNSLLRHKNFDIYVTGSNSRFLSSDIMTEFNGRGSEIHVLPLVFSEYCEGLDIAGDAAWKEYIVTGGIPVVATMKTEVEKETYLKNLCEETYVKDIITRNEIKKSVELSDSFNIFASMIGSPINVSKITDTFKSVLKKSISDDTMADFIRYFEESFILSKAKKYNIKGRKYINAPYKLYFEDVGVRNARLGFNQIEETHLMENIIYNELRYRGFNVAVGEVNIREKTDRKDKNGKIIYASKALEVDFIAVRGNQKYYVQSALSMSDPDKQIQEKKSLYYIDDSFKKIVITKNGLNPTVDEKGVYVVDLFDFLMNSDRLL